MPFSLFFSPPMKPLAQRIASAAGEQVRLCSLSWGSFPDSWPNVFFGNWQEDIYGRDVVFLASFQTPADVFAQYGVLCALSRYGAKSLTIILPYFPTATMEREQGKGEVVTAMTLARLLSSIPPASSPPAIVFLDPHTPDLRFYFGDSVRPYPATVLSSFVAHHLNAGSMVAFPDLGSRKRFAHFFGRDFSLILFEKVRTREKRELALLEGDPAGRTVWIVDDMVQTGGTIAECAKLLRARGAAEVNAFAVHGVFPEDSWSRFCAGGPYYGLLNTFMITDSCPRATVAVDGREPFLLFSIGPLIAHYLKL